MRAWIEVSYTSSGNVRNIVALYMRAWIEVSASARILIDVAVALYMRAWIEVYHIHNGNFRS